MAGGGRATGGGRAQRVGRGAAWEGIWGFPLTPFARRGIDLDALAAGVEHQIAGGVDALCACGAIAQGELLDPAEHAASVAAVVAQAAGRVPVLATLAAGRGAARRADA